MLNRYMLFTTVVLLIVKPSTISAQSKGFQFQMSSVNFSSYDRIKRHIEYGLANSFPTTKRVSLRLELGYYQYKYYWNQRSFEYCGTTYTSRNGQLWCDHSLIIVVLISPYKNLYLGGGIGANRIYIKRILFSGWTSFWVDSYDNVILVNRQDKERAKICFAGALIAGWQQPIWRNASILVEGKYKCIAAGKNLTDTKESIVRVFSLLFGIAINFD